MTASGDNLPGRVTVLCCVTVLVCCSMNKKIQHHVRKGSAVTVVSEMQNSVTWSSTEGKHCDDEIR